MQCQSSKADPVSLYTPIPGRAMRIAVFGSGSGSNLQALLEAQQNNSKFEVVAVLTDRECRCNDLARQHGIPQFCNNFLEFFKGRSRQSVSDREAYDKQSLSFLEQVGDVDVLALCGYMRLIKAPLLRAFPRRVLNVHPGDLSVVHNGVRDYVGMDAVGLALRSGETRTRSSVLLVDESVDGGPVLASGPWVDYQGDRPISKKAVDLHQARQKKYSDWPVLTEAVAALAAGRVALDDQRIVYIDGEALGPSGMEM